MKEWKDEAKTDWKLLRKIILAGVFLWIVVTSTIQRFTHPNLTDTQLFLSVPKSFMLDFSGKE